MHDKIVSATDSISSEYNLNIGIKTHPVIHINRD